MEIWHLFHSTFALQDGREMVVFDYWMDEPSAQAPARSLAGGVMAPEGAGLDRLTAFSSHKHGDHFSPRIFDWRGTAGSVRYVLSWDIPKRFDAEDVVRMRPHETAEVNGMRIETLRSTDAGVAFLIEWNGRTIYHAGDLHLWLWDGESKQWNSNMRARYEKELALLEGKRIDLAFIPLDARQEAHAADGMRWFMSRIGAGTVFGMHFGEDYASAAKLGESLRGEPWHDRLVIPAHRGERFLAP